MGFILKNLKGKKAYQIMFLTGLPTYLGSIVISTLLFPSLFSIHWIWFFMIWFVFDFIFDIAYQHVYQTMYQKEVSQKEHITKWFYYKLTTLQLIIIVGLFAIASPYF